LNHCRTARQKAQYGRHSQCDRGYDVDDDVDHWSCTSSVRRRASSGHTHSKDRSSSLSRVYYHGHRTAGRLQDRPVGSLLKVGHILAQYIADSAGFADVADLNPFAVNILMFAF
jgi:hypothetical protein